MPTTDPAATSNAMVSDGNYVNSNLLGRTARYQSIISNTGNGLQVLQNQATAYGIGLTLPFNKTDGDPLGFHLAMTTAQAVQSDLVNLIMTNKGERLGNPEFGTNLQRFLFEQNTPDIEPLIEDEIRGAMAVYQSETGIGIDNITIAIDRADNNGNNSHSLRVLIKYAVLGDVQTILTELMGRAGDDSIYGPTFTNYKTTSAELSNLGQPIGHDSPQWIDDGFDTDEFIID